jgi:RHS repeat-associated protein
VYDGDDVVLILDETGSFKNRYLHGDLVDQVFMEESIGEILWGLGDNQGTIRDVANYDPITDTSAVLNHRQFDAFGKITAETNGAIEFRYAYTARYLDEDTGLQLHGFRWYDAGVGRWVSEDPIGILAGDPNFNRYVENSPANFTDPSGLDPRYAWNWHHLLSVELFDPQKSDVLKQNGIKIDINDSKYGWMLQGKDHQGNNAMDSKGVHSGDPEWNKDWKKWLDKRNNKFTQEELDQQVEVMKKRHGLVDKNGKVIKGSPAPFSKCDWDEALRKTRESRANNGRRGGMKARTRITGSSQRTPRSSPRGGFIRLPRLRMPKAPRTAGAMQGAGPMLIPVVGGMAYDAVDDVSDGALGRLKENTVGKNPAHMFDNVNKFFGGDSYYFRDRLKWLQ